jgi:ABC-type uncharacterized transport system substrate-binding protein
MSSRRKIFGMLGAARLLCTALLCCAALLGGALCGRDSAWAEYAAAVAPSAGPAGLKTIAYFEAGPDWEFALLEKEIRSALQARGLLGHFDFPAVLRFSPGWDAPQGAYREAARKIMQNPQVDAVISMGTEATKALLAENNGATPIMAVDVADPAGAGIVDPETGKGAKNLAIRYIKDKWFKVFALFHEALPFHKLGIMYHDSPEGLSYSNVREAREVARERGFSLVEYPLLDKAESPEACARGVRRLLQENVDAFYISALNCFDWTQADPQPLFDLLAARGVKTFARDGSVHVRRGALMGLSTLDYAPLGRFYADQLAAQLGLLPPDAPLEAAAYTPKIALNLVTANRLGLDLPLLLLISADELFDATLAGVDAAPALPYP